MHKIAWITPTAYLDTDLYVIEQLADYYQIDWFIVKRKIDKIDYPDIEERFSQKVNLHIVSIGARHRDHETFQQYWKLSGIIRKGKYDAVYSSVANFPYFIPILSLRIPRKNVILAVHNVSKIEGGMHPTLTGLYNKLAFRKFHHFHTFSQSQYEAAKALAPKKDIRQVAFIPKDYGRAQLQRIDSTITFLNFGHIRTYKRLDILIQAAEKAYAATNIPFKVIIAGGCADWTPYAALIQHDFLFDIRLGRVQNESIPDLFEESDYFVVPYQSIAQSGALMVAINYEKPIIASRLKAFEECVIHEENGLLVEPADVDALADALVFVLQNHKDIHPLWQSNLRAIKNSKYSVKNITDDYCEFIDSVIAHK